MWSALMRRARPIALCSECWNGADWKSNEYVSHVRECGGFYFVFVFIFPFLSGLCVGNGSLVQAASGKSYIYSKTLQLFSRPTKSKFWPRFEVTF
jgi:hypothetical protein